MTRDITARQNKQGLYLEIDERGLQVQTEGPVLLVQVTERGQITAERHMTVDQARGFHAELGKALGLSQ